MTVAAPRTLALAAPFSLAATRSMPDWRERLFWPADTRRVADLGPEFGVRILAWLSTLDDAFERRVALVAGPNLIGRAMTLAEAALAVQGEAGAGIRLTGVPPLVGTLRGEGDAEEVHDQGFSRPVIFTVRQVPRPGMRRVARTASWTPWWRLAGALLAPQATAISHNGNLRVAARAAGARLDFRHADWLLARSRRTGAADLEQPGLLEAAVSVLTPVEGLVEPFAGRMAAAFRAQAGPVLARVAADVRRLESFADLPAHTWSGNSGYYPTRVLSAEVRRRGGTHAGFDHGGTSAISELIPTTALVELATTSRFTLGTPAMAEALLQAQAPGLVVAFNRPEIHSLPAEASYRRFCLDGPAPAGRRRRVLYPTVRFRGFRQYALVDPPDPVHLDLQLTLAQTLVDAGADLLCKPHPEGTAAGASHPLAAVAPVSARPFEEHVAEAGAFVFDSLNSTVFGQACCTDRPVVFLDTGCCRLNPAVADLVRRRIRTVPARFDESGRIRFEREALIEAVLGGADTADPTEARRLWAGTWR